MKKRILFNRKINYKKLLATFSIGTSLISSLCSCTINDNLVSKNDIGSKDYYIANVGDHNNPVLDSKKEKIIQKNEKDIPVGIIINSEAKNESDIYNDVEYAKSIINDFIIDYPVYLDINTIVNDDELDDEQKALLIRDFLEKCEKNNMYVGVYGTDTNLSNLIEELDFSGKEYDAFVVMDKPKIEYSGSYNGFIDTNSCVNYKTDLSEIINKHDLNNPKNFINDLKYIVSEGDTVDSISSMFNMSFDDIAKFNDLDTNDLKIGDELRIPKLSDINLKKKNDTDFFVGCDVSHYQTENNTNWDILSKNFDFMILKSNEGLKCDPLFNYYAIGCAENNIPIGVYCFNKYWSNKYDLNDFIKKQEEQADYTISLLKDKKIDYPVYLDVERPNGLSESNLPYEYTNAMLDIWYNKMVNAGYIPGLYGGQAGLNYLQSNTDYSLNEKFELWVAGGPVYNKPVELENINPSFDSLRHYDESLKSETNMIQPTEACINGGAGNSAGYLDIDYSRVNYGVPTNTFITEGNYEIKKFKCDDSNNTFFIVLASIGALSMVGVYAKIDDVLMKKEEEKRKTLKIRRGDFK